MSTDLIAGPALAHWLRRRGTRRAWSSGQTCPSRWPGGGCARGGQGGLPARWGCTRRCTATEILGSAHMVDATGGRAAGDPYRCRGGAWYISEFEGRSSGDRVLAVPRRIRNGVEYVFGDQIAELAQDADGVDVAFAGAGLNALRSASGADRRWTGRCARGSSSRRSPLVTGSGEVAWPGTPAPRVRPGRWMIEYRLGSRRCPLLRPMRGTRAGGSDLGGLRHGACSDVAATTAATAARADGLPRMSWGSGHPRAPGRHPGLLP